VNGESPRRHLAPGSYAEVRRVWRNGDTVRLQLPMPPRRMQSHPYALENTDRVALMRGPLLYCVEEADHPDVDLRDITLPAAGLKVQERADLLGGVITLTNKGRVRYPEKGWPGQLYRPAESIGRQPRGSHIEVVAIPYYAWANRGLGQMQVWLKAG